jgi:tetratricopeptide (TPR) repeat protein
VTGELEQGNLLAREPGDKDFVSDATFPWQLAAVTLALVAMTVAAYWPVSGNDFINFDDHIYLTQNRHISEGLSLEGIKWAFTEYYSCNWHPVTWLSHMLDVEMFGMNAGGHHLVSLGLHIANTLLLMGFLYRTTTRFWPSVFAAAMFALHPLHVESVAWASERKDVLSAFFWFATMWAYSFYVKRPGWKRYSAVMILYALGLMSKPMLVTLPIVLLLLDRWPLERTVTAGRHKGEAVSLLRLAAEKLPLLAMAAISAIVTIDAQRGATSTLDAVGLPARLTNAAISCWRYIEQMLLPIKLAVLYPYVNRPQYMQAAVALLLLVCATVAAIYWRRRFRYVLTGWLWYLIMLVPVIGLVQVGEQSHADRYTYLPLVGIFIIISWGVADVVGRISGLRKAIVPAAVVVLVVSGVLTWRQAGYWKDSVTLLERTVMVTKDNHVAMANLGNALVARGELDRAMEEFQKSLNLAPRKAETLSGIGKVLFEKGQLAESWGYYKLAVEARPDLKDTQLNAGAALIALGRYAEAEGYLREAIRLDGRWAEPYAQLGIALGGIGRPDEGIAACKKSLELKPGLGAAHFSLAALYAMKGDLAAAVEEYRKCLAIEQNYSVMKNLGGCLLAMGEKEEALNMFRDAVRLRPRFAESYYNLAMALESLGRKEEAIAEVRKAIELEPRNAAAREYLEKLLEGSM